MAYRLYVGNYPFNFSKEGVMNLFKDFDGIKMDKMITKDSKSFSFLICKDIDQLMSVISKMNKTVVCGRNLVVRASDRSLQEYVDLILQNNEFSPGNEKSHSHQNNESSLLLKNDGSPSSKEQFVPTIVIRNKRHQQMKKGGSGNLDFDTNTIQPENCFSKSEDIVETNGRYCSKSIHNRNHQNYDENDSGIFSNSSDISSVVSEVNGQSSHKENKYFERSLDSYKVEDIKNEHENYEKTDCQKLVQKSYSYQVTKHLNTDCPNNVTSTSQNYHQLKSKGDDHDQHEINIDNLSECSSSVFDDSSSVIHHSVFDDQASKSKNDQYLYRQRDTISPTWVSVTNFRFNVSSNTLYHLFSDYKPLEIKMICNRPCYDRNLTEAHVCFPSKEIADDVIMTFDNTVFQGRIIMVNDVDDLTMLDELLTINLS